MWWGARKLRKGRLKGSKMSSWAPNMRPKWLPGGLRGVPWKPLGGPGASRAIFERFWVPFWRPFGTEKGSTSVLKLSLKSSSASERHLGPLGAVLGSMLGSFWGRLGLCFAVRRPNTKTLIFDDLLTRNRVFSGPGGSQNQSKIGPESLLALELAPKASWRPLGLDFVTLWGSQNGPPRSLESKLKFEASLSDFGSREPKGRRQ